MQDLFQLIFKYKGNFKWLEKKCNIPWKSTQLWKLYLIRFIGFKLSEKTWKCDNEHAWADIRKRKISSIHTKGRGRGGIVAWTSLVSLSWNVFSQKDDFVFKNLKEYKLGVIVDNNNNKQIMLKNECEKLIKAFLLVPLFSVSMFDTGDNIQN